MLETADIIEIRRVLELVHHLIDLRRFDELHKVFAEDAVYDLSYRNLAPVLGCAGIKALCEKSFASDYTHLTGHHCTNIYIYVDPDGTVKAKSKVLCVMQDGTSQAADMDDIIAKTAAGWRIKRRTASSRHKDAVTWTTTGNDAARAG